MAEIEALQQQIDNYKKVRDTVSPAMQQNLDEGIAETERLIAQKTGEQVAQSDFDTEQQGFQTEPAPMPVASTDAQIKQIDEQLAQYENLIKTVDSPETKNQIAQNMSQLNVNRAKLAGTLAQEQAVEGPPIVQQPAMAPQVSPTGQIIDDPRLRPAEEVQQEVMATSPETPRADVVAQPTPRDEGIGTTSLSQIPDAAAQTGAFPMLRTTTTQIKQGAKLSPELKAKLGDGSKYITELGKIDKEIQDNELARQKLLTKYDEANTGFMRAEEKRIADHKADIANRLSTYDKESEAISKEKIDSRRFWKNATTGQTIGMAIASALSAVSMGLTGQSTNQAVKLITNAIDKDIKEQTINLQHRKDMNKEYMQRIKHIDSKFNTEQGKRFAMLNTTLKPLSMQLDDLAKRSTTALQRSNIIKMKQGIDSAILNAQIKAEQAEAPQVSTVIQEKPNVVSAKDLATRIAAERKANRKSRELGITGFTGEARTVDEAKEMRGQVMSYDNLEDAVNRIRALNKEFGSNVNLISEQRARVEMIRGLLKGTLRKPIVGPGAVTEHEQKMLNDLIANPTAIFEVNAMDKLDELVRTMRVKINSFAKSQELTPTDPRFGGSSGSRQLQQTATGQ